MTTSLTISASLAVVAAVVAAPASIVLPGGAPVGMDYLAYDAATGRIWVPAGNTGNVDVIDTATRRVTPITGLPTSAAQRPDRPRRGPSSAAVGDGVVWIGNRADSSVCSFGSRTLQRGPCVQLQSSPDGVAYVAATRELWVTTPRDRSITIVDSGGAKPAVHATVKLDGAPEGYAVDTARGVFYTNLEDKDQTLAIDVKSRQIVARWSPGCGAEGPRGLAIDGARRLLFVACTDGAVTLDLAKGGQVVGRLKTGAGVDNIDYHAKRQLLYVASGRDATLTIARVGAAGALTSASLAPTAKGARTAVVDTGGTAYVADAAGGRLIVFPPDGEPAR